jgi:hypothetical protein
MHQTTCTSVIPAKVKGVLEGVFRSVNAAQHSFVISNIYTLTITNKSNMWYIYNMCVCV